MAETALEYIARTATIRCLREHLRTATAMRADADRLIAWAQRAIAARTAEPPVRETTNA